jgi:hypothetical protein
MSTKPQTASNAKPIEKFNVGTVQVSIWRNEAGDGRVFFKAEVSNAYRDDEGWKQTNAFSSRQLIHLAKVALLAHSAIGKLDRAQRPADDGEPLAEDDGDGQ